MNAHETVSKLLRSKAQRSKALCSKALCSKAQCSTFPTALILAAGKSALVR